MCQEADALTSSSGGLCLPFTEDDDFFRWTYPGVGRQFFFMLAQSAVIAAFIAVKEFGLFSRLEYLLRSKSLLSDDTEPGVISEVDTRAQTKTLEKKLNDDYSKPSTLTTESGVFAT